MNQKTTIEMVREFHEAFGVETPEKPTLTNASVNSLRISLLQEELDELKDAVRMRDAVGVMDALTDLQVVLDGTYLALGLAPAKEEAFAEVHRSNMSKLGEDGKPIYREDGKVMKGPKYTKPQLRTIVLKLL